MMKSQFDLLSAQDAARQGRIHEWVQDYLRAGEWTNLGLADGLLLAPRWWLGPFQAPLTSFSRKCGPETEMEYRMPLELWNSRVEAIVSTIRKPEELPPLIGERRETGWFLADGNHRHEALRRLGCKSCWAFAWYNSQAEFELARVDTNASRVAFH